MPKKKNILDKLAEEVDRIDEDQPVMDVKDATPQVIEDNSVMGKLLEENPIEVPKVGDVLQGVVVDTTSNSLLLDFGPLGTGVVLGKEIKDGLSMGNKLKKGDVVNATLMDLENDEGYMEFSVREASYEKAWEDIESKRDTQESVSTKILDANKGGLMVEVNGITGFLPVSQLSSEHYPRVEDGDKNKILDLLKRLVGKEMEVRILDADREAEKLIVSEKAASSDRERAVISQLKAGDIIEGEVSGVVDFGAFVKFPTPGATNPDDMLEGLVHISELAWQLIENPREIVKTGDKVMAKIIGIDDTRISLSMKALKMDPWVNVREKYNPDDVVEGKVDKINPFGAFVYLDKNIHGLAHVSELQQVFPGSKIEEVLRVGQSYSWKILSIEPKEHRMGLMLVKDGEKSADEKTVDDKKSSEAETTPEEKKEKEVEVEVEKKPAKKKKAKKEKTVESGKEKPKEKKKK